MSALSQAELWLIDAVLRGHRQGRGQPALCCLHREIASKRPAARVKKILHSGSAQMNPGGAWNCFQWHSTQYIITQRNSVTNDNCKCGFSWRFRLSAWYICLYLHMQGVTRHENKPIFLLGYILHSSGWKIIPLPWRLIQILCPQSLLKRCQSRENYLPWCPPPHLLHWSQVTLMGRLLRGSSSWAFDLSWKPQRSPRFYRSWLAVCDNQISP